MTRAADGGVMVGVDIGGTFTDLVAFDPTHDTAFVEKVPSTPSAPARGVLDGLRALLDDAHFAAADISLLSHGSTVTINALLERDGARTGLLVTEGAEAIPLARHGEKPLDAVKDPRYQQPGPLVPQDRVLGVPERVGADGEVVTPLDEAAARDAIITLRDHGVDSIAICFLFSFLEPAHEERVADLVRDLHPECDVTRSSAVAPRIREFPRLSTTTVSAYVGPILRAYLADLETRLDDLGVSPDELSMMLSHGGLTRFDAAAATPAATVLSGPAAGVQGARFTADSAGITDIVTMDMGGTSCDIAVAPDGEPVTTTDTEIEQNPISIPLIDIGTIGAGGGTIARVENGRLRVGPESAGADPGPVCYGRGGNRPTITDANVVLGRLGGDARLGGSLAIDAAAARDAVEDHIAEPLGLTVVEAAEGVVRVVNDKMKKELSLALTRRGYDPRRFALVVFGGAGPMHAPAIARELSIGRVVVPLRPGINSAVGLLATDRKRLYERSRIDRLDAAPIDDEFASLEAAALDDLEAAVDETGDVRLDRELELRYAGQSYELTVPVDASPEPAELRDAFNERHRETYGHVSDRPIETMTYRVTATVTTATLPAHALAAAGDPGDGDARTRGVVFDGREHDTPVYHRDALAPGARVEGPAVVEQSDTTIVVEPGMAATADDAGNLVLDVGGATDA